MSQAILTCATCFSRKTVEADLVVDGLDLATWWIGKRHHSCKECFNRTCWKPVAGEACHLDKGHPGRCLPFLERYADVGDDVEPLVGLWA